MGKDEILDLPWWTDTNKHKLVEIKYRFEVARLAILDVRAMDVDRFQHVFIRKDGTSTYYDKDGTEQKYPLFAYGAMGLLRYIETGDTNKISDPRLREKVEKEMANK